MARTCEHLLLTHPLTCFTHWGKTPPKTTERIMWKTCSWALAARCCGGVSGFVLVDIYIRRKFVLLQGLGWQCALTAVCAVLEDLQGVSTYNLVHSRRMWPCTGQCRAPLPSLCWLDASRAVSSWITSATNSSRGLNLALALRSERGSA